MCGIVAYLGTKQAYPIVMKGLQRLEYRGYDSAGIALINNGLHVYKKAGKVSDLAEFTKDKDVTGSVGMGHTRWATHGEPNDRQVLGQGLRRRGEHRPHSRPPLGQERNA